MNKEPKQVIVDKRKTVPGFFAEALYDSLLFKNEEIVLSTIDLYHDNVVLLIGLLKLSGWELMPNMPIKEVKQGKNIPLHLLKYHLKLTEALKTIRIELYNQDRIKKILEYLDERKKLEEKLGEVNKVSW